MRAANIAIVGATGMVGRTFLKILEERQFPIYNIYFFASQNSAGKEIEFHGEKYFVEELTEQSFERPLDIALFSAGGAISAKYAPIAASKGIVVVDNSSFWRMDSQVPLIVPEVNQDQILSHHGIIANPNCSTIQAVIPLSVIHEHYQIKRINYTTFQAVSGSGYKGINDLCGGLEGKSPSFYPKPIFNNCLPQIDDFLDSGYTKEEMKMVNETKKILNDPSLLITATCVRIPVQNAHSMAINVECVKPFILEELILKLKNKEGLVIYDTSYPTPLDVVDQDLVHVGRIRRDDTVPNGLNLWVVADNIRKGAATNAVQIAQILWKEKQ